MKTPTIRRAVLPGVAGLALALTGCAASNEGGSDETGGVEAGSLSGQYTVGGASSQEAAQLAWTTGFTDVQPDVTMTYEPIGSGGGRENFIAGGYMLAGSDSYLKDDEGELTDATERCGGEEPKIGRASCRERV